MILRILKIIKRKDAKYARESYLALLISLNIFFNW